MNHRTHAKLELYAPVQLKQNPEILGKAFAADLLDYLGAKKFAEVCKRNDLETTDCCHSHDFCDANMVMLNAYCRLTGTDENDVDIEAACELFNDAWDYARAYLLTRKVS